MTDAAGGAAALLLLIGIVIVAVCWIILPFIIMSRLERIHKEMARMTELQKINNEWLERSDALLERIEKNTRQA